MRETVRSLALAVWVAAAFAQTPSMTVNGIGNAASTMGSAIAPGSLATIFGAGLAGSLATADSATLSTSLADVNAVTFNGIPAPLALVSDSQIRVQVPWEVTPGTAAVVVSRGGVAGPSMNAQVSAFSPAVFTLNFGTPIALATNSDNTLIAPAGAIPGVTSHPASPGDTITIYAEGLGPTDVQPVNGMPSSDAVRNVTNPPTVLFGGAAGQVTFAGLSPQYAGIYQINVVVPAGVSGNVPLQIQVGGAGTVDPVTIAIGGM